MRRFLEDNRGFRGCRGLLERLFLRLIRAFREIRGSSFFGCCSTVLCDALELGLVPLDTLNGGVFSSRNPRLIFMLPDEDPI